MYQYVWFAVDLANQRTRDADRQHLLHGDHLARPSRVRQVFRRLTGGDRVGTGTVRQLDGYAAK